MSPGYTSNSRMTVGKRFKWAGGRAYGRAQNIAMRNPRAAVPTRATVSAATVTINDRGPFVGGRVIDLTPAASKAIRMGGLARVEPSTE